MNFKVYKYENNEIELIGPREGKKIRITCGCQQSINYISYEDFRRNTALVDEVEIECKYESLIRNLDYKINIKEQSNLQIIKLMIDGAVKYLVWIIVNDINFKVFVISNVTFLTFSGDGHYLGTPYIIRIYLIIY